MANRTAKEAKVVHGTNPQYLVEKIIRTRIYESRYWKEECFGLSAADVFEKAIQLRFIGGTYGGNIKPTPFLCLILKMLQIQPDQDIIIHFIGKIGETYKYVRALGAYYLRLTASSLDNWKYLDPLYNDFRKLRIMDRMGRFSVIHVDEFIDLLLRDERVFDVILPRISKRRVHEEASELDPRISALEQDIDDGDIESESDHAKEEEEEKERVKEKKRLKDKHKQEKKEKEKKRLESAAAAGKDLQSQTADQKVSSKRHEDSDTRSGSRRRSRSGSRNRRHQERNSSRTTAVERGRRHGESSGEKHSSRRDRSGSRDRRRR